MARSYQKFILAFAALVFSFQLQAKMTMTFLDVGQGDAEFIELPNGKTVLIDGGPSKNSLVDFLKAKNIQKIDYMVLSHPHTDHYSGLNWVVDNLKVEHFYDSNLPGAAGIERLRSKIKEKGIEIHYPKAGESLDWSEETFVKVYNNCVGTDVRSTNPNNCSLVLKITHHEQSALFLGDVETAATNAMLKDWKSELRAEVMKVAHHGSASGTSKELLEAVQPREAYIEVGKDNNYGHPTTKVLDLLQNQGTKIFRSDLDGSNSVSFD